MNRVPIRLRLALAFTLAMALVLVVLGAFLYWRLATTLDNSLNDQLEVSFDALAQVAQENPGGLTSAEPAAGAREEGAVQLLSPDARVLFHNGLREPLLAGNRLASATERTQFFKEVAVPQSDEPFRLLAGPVSTPTGPAVLVVAGSTEDLQEALSGFAAQLSLGGPLLLAAGFLLAYMLTATALRPVESMRKKAEQIEAEDPSGRLPVPPANDEIARLGTTLNELFDRLEESIERERAFFADASHELRTPLAMLRMELELALRQGRTHEELEAALRSASAEAERLSRLAEDLLVLARAEQGQLALEPVSFAAGKAMEAVAERYRTRVRAEQRDIAVEEAGREVTIYADRHRIEQALGDLVDNALRHGAGQIELRATGGTDTVELEVSDRGPGFGADNLARAFDRFTQGDAARGGDGAGLGLAIVKAIVETHGGRVRAENLPEGGAAVHLIFTLPETTEAPPPESKRSRFR